MRRSPWQLRRPGQTLRVRWLVGHGCPSCNIYWKPGVARHHCSPLRASYRDQAAQSCVPVSGPEAFS